MFHATSPRCFPVAIVLMLGLASLIPASASAGILPVGSMQWPALAEAGPTGGTVVASRINEPFSTPSIGHADHASDFG